MEKIRFEISIEWFTYPIHLVRIARSQTELYEFVSFLMNTISLTLFASELIENLYYNLLKTRKAR